MNYLSYKRLGKGRPLVLVHGYLGGQNMWRFQEELKEDFDLIMPSLAGIAILFCALILDRVIQGKKKD